MRGMRIVSSMAISLLFGPLHRTNAQEKDTPKKEFEVASVRPVPKPAAGQFPCDIQSKPVDLSLRLSGNTFEMRSTTLGGLIMDAYNIREDQFAGLPGWADCTDLYQIKARTPGATSPDQIRLMLQTLLAARFQLRLRHETKNLTVYEMTVAKSGAKLKLFPDLTPEHRNAWGKVSTLIQLFLDYPIVDETGLYGFFETNYVPKLDTEQLQQERPAGLAPGTLWLAPSTFREVEKEFGITLKKVTGPRDFIVIEHVERPSEN
jgi:hypothetical protein